MVNAVNGEDLTTAALGTEIDDLVPEYENGDVSYSPEHNCSSDKPVFEDIIELPDNFEDTPGKSSWDSINTTSTGGKDWGAVNLISEESQVDSTSPWGIKTAREEAPSPWGAAKTAKEDAPSPWGTAKTATVDVHSPWGTKTTKEEAPSSWGSAKSVTEDASAWATAKTATVDAPAAWGTKTTKEAPTPWESAKSATEDASAWGTKTTKEETPSPWGTAKTATVDALSSWGTNPTKEDAPSQWETKTAWGRNTAGEDASTAWGKNNEKKHVITTEVLEDSEAESTDLWFKKAEVDSTSNGWNAFSVGATKPQKESAGSGWGMKGSEKKGDDELEQDKSTALPSWGQRKPADTSSLGAWGSRKSPEIFEGAWGQKKPADTSSKQKSPEIAEGAWGQQKPADTSSLGAWGSEKSLEIAEGAWGQKKPAGTSQPATVNQWDSPSVGDGNAGEGAWGQQKPANTSSLGAWGSEKSLEIAECAWDQKKPAGTSQPAIVSQWDSPSVGDGNAGERHQVWGHNGDANKRRRFEGGRGWGPNAGEWKGKNSHPAKSPGMVNNDSSVAAIYTTTRQRLDIFTSEEQDVLSHIEPIMLSIRRIMHQSGYNDGDRFSDEDHKYILDQVFNFHPDKDVKMGSGIDYFTVDRHGSFQESRCLFVISTDGHKEDFSYRKCLQNMVKEKYPELAEEFNSKYFVQPRSRNPSFSQTPPPESQ